LLNNFSEACPYGLSSFALRNKFNLPMPEQSHYDVIVISGVAKVPTPGDKTIFAPPPTKEVKNRRKNAEMAKALYIAVCYFCLFFEVIKHI